MPIHGNNPLSDSPLRDRKLIARRKTHMSAAAPFTKHDLETRLIEECWKDPEFKAEVLADPKAKLEEFLGTKLPENFKVIIHQDDASTLHLAVPPAPAAAAELSDEDLEKIAGGTELVFLGTHWLLPASAAGSAVLTASTPIGQRTP
jgi:hypothetical protein